QALQAADPIRDPEGRRDRLGGCLGHPRQGAERLSGVEVDRLHDQLGVLRPVGREGRGSAIGEREGQRCAAVGRVQPAGDGRSGRRQAPHLHEEYHGRSAKAVCQDLGGSQSQLHPLTSGSRQGAGVASRSIRGDQGTGEAGGLGARLGLPALLAPTYLVLTVAIFLPLLIMFAFSLLTDTPLGGRHASFTLDQYAAYWGSPTFRYLTLRSLLMGAHVTLGCILLGFPLAYVLARN